MIKIITKGPENFETVCPRCLCRFTYEIPDLFQYYSSSEYVKCPQCKYQILHRPEYVYDIGAVKETEGTW